MKPVVIDKLLGEINTRKPDKLPLGACVLTNNVQVTGSSTLKKRHGYTLTASGTSILSSYGTQDERFIFLVDNGSLYRFDVGGVRALASGLGSNAVYWAEESSNRVFMTTPGLVAQIDDGETITGLHIDKPEGVAVQAGGGSITCELMIAVQYKDTASGLLGPLSDPVSITLTDASVLVTIPAQSGMTAVVHGYTAQLGAWHVFGETNSFLALNTLPTDGALTDMLYFDVESPPLFNTVALAFHQSRLVAAVLESPALSRIQFSVPYQYHLFHATDDRFEIPDQVTGMASIDGQLLITCRNSIYVLTSDTRLLRLVDYGTPYGKPIQKLPEGGAMIWTTRGVCKYPEFANLSQDSVSVTPGNGCSTAWFAHGGDQYLLVCNDGQGTAYNVN